MNFGWWNKENSVYPFVRDAQKESVTEEIDQRIESMIQEFVEIENIDELDICLRELNSPQSHELFVKRLLSLLTCLHLFFFLSRILLGNIQNSLSLLLLF